MSYPKFVDRPPVRSESSRILKRRKARSSGKHRSPIRLSIEALDARLVLSGTPQLVDINAAGASSPSDFVQVGAIAFFAADNGTNGRELWRTDGTPQGTALVKDIQAGATGSNPLNLTNVNGTLFFTADDGANGVELWKSDGTSGGTVLVANIGDGTTASAPQNLTNVNGTLFFSADDSINGRELWKSDGTSAGTVLVKDIFAGLYDDNPDYPYSSVPTQLTNVNGTLFFVAGDDSAGRELWKSDGTAAGTVMVKDIFPGEYEFMYEGYSYGFYPNNGSPDKLTVSGGVLYFTADDEANGRELWKSDGTDAGTVRLANIRDGAADAFTSTDDLAEVNGTLFFTATDDTNGRELWKTDGTANGTVRVRDISPGTASGVVGNELLAVDGVVYFSATDGVNGTELWRSDGTTAGTVMVANIEGSSGSSAPTLLTNIDGTIYFAASDAAAGSELWQSNGTSAGTQRVADIVSGVSGSAPQNLFGLDGTLLFSADNLTAGRELWILDAEAVAGLATARLTIYVNSLPVSIPANIGVDGTGNSLAQVHTTAAGTLRVEPIGGEPLEPVTLGDFFATWRTSAGQAGNNASATFGATQLMGSVADTTKTVKMFVNGHISTEFDNYVVQDGDQIVLVFGENPVVSLNTNFGPIVMELFEQATPITVANFLDYINDGDYINSFFHRAAESGGQEFVIQGGGFRTSSTTFSSTAQFTNVPTEQTILNEPGISNVRGTVAMAKLGGDPNSATSQFFVNLNDGNTFLDSVANGAFTVFAQVLDMTTADTIAALPRNTSNPSPYGELPLSTSNQLVVVQSIEGLGEISGVKYFDANANGQRDSGETGVAGINVYVDVNNNGVLDAGDISTTTDSTGRYLLQVEPGSYIVRAELSPGYIESEPLGNTGYSVDVLIGIESGDRDFGEITLSAPTSVDLSAASDTGAASDDDLTNLNNASASATLQFVVDGVTGGAEVRIYSDGVLIGSATAVGPSVTVTTSGTTLLADGSRSITATQSLGGVESDPTAALAITIDATPPAAIASTAAAIAQVGQAYAFDADSPDEGQTGVVYSLVDAPTGMTINSDTGEVTWTPTLDQAVPQAFSIRVSDAAGNAATQDVAMTVLGVIPALPDEYAATEDTPLVIDTGAGVLANDGDENSGTLSASVVTGPTHGTLTLNADGSFTYTPNANFNGTDTFTYKATDDSDESNVAQVTITIAAVDDPVAVAADAYSVNEDAVLTVNATSGVLGNDVDVDGDTLTAALVTSTSNGTLAFNANGSFTYTPNANFNGNDSFSYTVNDGTTTSDPVTVALTVTPVNDAPVGTPDAYSVNEDAVLTVNAATGVLANDTDAEGTALTASVVTNPTNGALTLNADGSFTYTPTANFSGTDTFSYRASDSQLQSAATTVTITVNSQPDAPVANDDTFSVANNGAAHSLTVLSNDTSNPDPGQTLTITAVTQGNSGGVVTFTGTTLSYTPAAGFVGTETFTYTIRDTDNLTDTATVTVTVTEAAGNSVLGFVYIDGNGNGVRDGGELGAPGAVITLTGTDSSGSAVSMTTISSGDGSYRFDDLVAGTYQLAQSQPEALIDGVESTTASGVVVGSDQFTNIVLSGGASVGELNFGERGLRPEYVSLRMFLSSTPPQDVMLRETIAVGEDLAGNTNLAATIRAGGTTPGSSNSAPLAVADAYAVATGGVLTVTAASGVLHNDADSDGDALTALSVGQPTNGTLSLAADGSFTYTPNVGFSGTDTFSYTPSDGTATSNTVAVTITVHATTNAPVAVVDSYVVNRNTALTVDAAGGLLANDSDAENDTLTAAVATSPTHGSLTLNANGSFTYTPNAGFVGVDTFTYQANDGSASSTAVTVSITVLDTNVAPTATADSYSTLGILTVNAAQGVLANDSDSNGDAITALLFSQTNSGSVSLSPDGSFTYTPAAGFTGTETFSYTANDGAASSAVTTVTITVIAATTSNVFALAENSPNGTVVGTATPPSSMTGPLLYDFTDVVTGTPAHLQLAADDHLIGDPSAPVVLIEYLDFQCPVCLTYHPVIEQLIDAYEGELLIVQRHFPLNVPHPNAFEAAQAAEAADRQGKFHEFGNLLFDNQDDWDSESDPTPFFEQYATQLGLNVDQFRTDMQDPAVAARINRDLAVADDMGFSGTPTFFLDGQAIDVAADVIDFADLIDDELADVDNAFFIDRKTGEITVATTAALNFETSGPFTLSINVRNASGTASTVTLTINLTDVNEAPTAAANTYSTSRDVMLSIGSTQGVLFNDSDVDGDTLTAQIVSNPTNGTLIFNADGSFAYTPNASFFGSDSFTYQAFDGSLVSTATTVTITVTDTNTAPTAFPDSYATDENNVLNVNAGAGVLANDTDVNGDALTAVLVAAPTHGTLTLHADGSFSYEPDADFIGNDAFTYVANDGTTDSESVVVAILITGVNTAPVSVADSYMVAQNGTLSVNTAGGVLANDTDGDGDTLTAQLVSQAANGTVTLNSDGSFTYTPSSGFSGNDSFTYRANDGQTNSNETAVSIAVAANNTFALAESAAAGAVVGQVVPQSGFGPAAVFEIEVSGQPSQLQLAADDHFTGDPAASVVLIEYMDLSCPHCRDIHPVVEDLLANFDGELLVVRRHLLLFNSTTSTFAFPNSLAAARAAEAAGRQGKFDEMVDKLFDNQDTWRSVSIPSTFFNQYAQDIGLDLTQFANDQSDPAIDARITRDRDAATALSLASTPSFFINGQQTTNPGTLAAFTPLIVNAIVDADAALAIDRETGQLFVNNPAMLNASTAPTIQINVRITDSAGAKQTVPVTVNVHAANNAPAAANDSYSLTSGSSLAIDALMGLLANDIDTDGDSLSAQLVSGPTNGTLSLNSNGSFTYTPNAGFTGSDSFTYVAKDSVAMSLQATASIVVESTSGSAAAIEAGTSEDDEESNLDGELVDAAMDEEEQWVEA